MKNPTNRETKIEVFYDGECPICRWEVNLYADMDKHKNIRWTDIEAMSDAALPLGKTRDDLLSRFHVKELDEDALSEWFMGVDAFARIWRTLPKLRYFAWLFSVPGLRQITQLSYKLFLRWQSWHRKRRK